MSFAIRNLAMTFQFDWPFNMGDKLRKHTDKKYRHTCGHTSTFFECFLLYWLRTKLSCENGTKISEKHFDIEKKHTDKNDTLTDKQITDPSNSSQIFLFSLQGIYVLNCRSIGP